MHKKDDKIFRIGNCTDPKSQRIAKALQFPVQPQGEPLLSGNWGIDIFSLTLIGIK